MIDEQLEDHDLVLTTVDNPHNPKIDFAKWKQWDEDNNYYTVEYIARLLDMEDGFDIEDSEKAEELSKKVVLDILENDVLNIYTLV